MNYLTKARVLAESVHRFHPDWVFHAVMCEPVGNDFDLEAEPFDNVITLEDLDIPGLPGWVFAHSLVETCTGAKGPALHKLLQLDDADAVVFLDPDIVVFSPLTAVTEALNRSSIVLTPHQLTPETDPEAVVDNEICSLLHGVFNLGFIAVRPDEEGQRFAQWWRDRLLVHCWDDKLRGLFTDQRWCDLIPTLFTGFEVLRNPGYNVATWNLSTRDVAIDADGNVVVNGEPLAFYHFTGYDSGAGRIMLNKYGPVGSAAHDLWDWYDAELINRDQETSGQIEWKYTRFEDGTRIEPEMRRLYRDRADLRAVFRDPFNVADEPAFIRWWQAEH